MALVETIGLLAVVAALIYWYCAKDHGHWEKRGIPYAKPTFLFGSLFDTILGKKNAGQVYEEIYYQFKGEKVVGLFNFLTPSLMVRDPDAVHRILTSEFHKFSANAFDVDEVLDPILAGNIFMQRGEKWKRNRQALSPAFTASRMKATFDTFQNIAEKLVKYLEKNPENEVKASMSLYTSEIVASWGCGIDGHSFEEEDPILQKLGKMIFQPSLSANLVIMIISFLPGLAKLLRIKFVPDAVPNFFHGVVNDLLQTRAKSDTHHKDFLQYFIDLKKKREISRNEDQNEITDKDIINGVVSFFLEGYETSSLVLSMMLWELTVNPEVQRTLREEIDEMFKKGPPTFDSINDLPYMSQVLSESVRRYNGMVLTKLCTESCDLDLGDGKSVHIEKDTTVMIPLLAIQSDPAYWDKPEIFDPSRFSKDATMAKGVYFPFGDGPRACIGMRIASTIIKTAVVNVLRNFELLRTKKTSPKFVQDPNHFMTFLKGGVHVKFSKRDL